MTRAVDLVPVAPWPVIAVLTALGVGYLLRCAVRRVDGTRWTWVSRAGALLVLAALALGPHVGLRSATYLERPDVQVVVALDRTASMAVQDVGGRTRLDRAVRDVVQVSRVTEGSLSLVTWGRRPRVVLPFVSDTGVVTRVAALVETERPVAGVGSSTNRPLGVLRREVERATAEHPERATYLVVMTDGENTERERQHSYAPVAAFLEGAVVLGYGTPEGGPVPLDPASPASYVIDPSTGALAVSRRDEDNLRRIADELEGEYVGSEDPAFLERVEAALEPDEREVPTSAPQSVAWLLALLLLALLVPELRGLCRSTREVRDLRGAT